MAAESQIFSFKKITGGDSVGTAKDKNEKALESETVPLLCRTIGGLQRNRKRCVSSVKPHRSVQRVECPLLMLSSSTPAQAAKWLLLCCSLDIIGFYYRTKERSFSVFMTRMRMKSKVSMLFKGCF